MIIVYPDVRWNNIGPLAGEKFLDLLQSSNSNLNKLELQGNHIGKDQLMAVGKNYKIRTIISSSSLYILCILVL